MSIEKYRPLFLTSRTGHGRSSFHPGLFGLIIGVFLIAMSPILDYKAKMNRFVFALNRVGYSFALFTEIAFTTMLICPILKGADRRLM